MSGWKVPRRNGASTAERVELDEQQIGLGLGRGLDQALDVGALGATDVRVDLADHDLAGRGLGHLWLGPVGLGGFGLVRLGGCRLLGGSRLLGDRSRFLSREPGNHQRQHQDEAQGVPRPRVLMGESMSWIE